MSKPDEIFLYPPVPPQADAVTVAWCYPATYTIAMASLGYLLLFAQLDKDPAVRAVRYSSEDWGNAPLNRYELMGFSFSFELDWLEVLNALEASDIPLLAEERSDEHPLVFSGGPVPSTNPEPYAPFFDFFLIGEGEELLTELMRAFRKNRHLPRQEKLKALALEVPGVYVPSLVEVVYANGPEGAIEGIHPRLDTMPFPVTKRMITKDKLDGYVATSPILSEASAFGQSYLVEVMRGCSHRCRFCLASYATLPARGATLPAIVEAIEQGLPYTKKLGLVGALIADHPQFADLCQYLDTKEGLQISFGAVRADTLTPAMCHTLAKSGSQSITLAIESGSPALRRRINKHLKQEAIFKAAETVAASGLKKLKLYGMVGLPDETEQDLEATLTLLKAIKKAHPKLQLSLGCSTFVPKAWTPFQWMPRLDTKLLKQRQERLRKGLIGVAQFRPSSARWDTLQALISRGDRRLAPLLLALRPYGAKPATIKRAYKDLVQSGPAPCPPPEWYANRERPENEVLPWNTLDLGLSPTILWKEAQRPLNWEPLATA